MVGLLEGLEDWGVKTAVDKVLDGYTKPVPPSKTPLISPADRPAFEKVAIDITNAILTMIAQKVETPSA